MEIVGEVDMTEHKIEKEHALKIIRAMRTNWDENSKTPNAHALDMAAEALEKQIPKAPFRLLKHIDFFDWECPKCHMTYGCCNVKVNYCYECGQAIKWE